jgi:hypothetical protein
MVGYCEMKGIAPAEKRVQATAVSGRLLEAHDFELIKIFLQATQSMGG